MKVLIALLAIFIFGSVSAEDSCKLIDQLKKDTQYLKSNKAYIENLYKDDTTTTKQLLGTGALFGAGSAFAISKLQALKAKDYASLIHKNGRTVDSRLPLLKKMFKSSFNSKAATVAGIGFAGVGIVLLVKDYEEKRGNYTLRPYLLTEIQDKKVLAKVCEDIESDKDLKASVKELALKLFISRAKVESIMASKENSILDDSDRTEIKETMKIVTKNIKNNRVNR